MIASSCTCGSTNWSQRAPILLKYRICVEIATYHFDQCFVWQLTNTYFQGILFSYDKESVVTEINSRNHVFLESC